MHETLPPARRMGDIDPFYVMDLLAKARALEAEGHDIVHLEIGEPDFVTAGPIIEAGQRALGEGKTFYTPALGLPALRQAISDYYRRAFQQEVSPERIVITPGASGALQLLLGALINPGDAVYLSDPGYPCNRHFVRLFEGEPVSMPVSRENDYQISIQQLAEAWSDRGRALLLASPANPTGALVPMELLREQQAWLRARGAVLIVDEIYQGLTYSGRSETALSLGDDLFVVNSFSKFFGMTGWRLGWLVAPSEFVPVLDKLAQNVFLAASTLAQHAALAAFEDDCMAILMERRERFHQRRDAMLVALHEHGIDVPHVPDGAFYVYVDVSRWTDDSFALCQRALTEFGVAVTPGRDFGRYRAEQHIRLAYTADESRLNEGVARLARALKAS